MRATKRSSRPFRPLPLALMLLALLAAGMAMVNTPKPAAALSATVQGSAHTASGVIQVLGVGAGVSVNQIVLPPSGALTTGGAGLNVNASVLGVPVAGNVGVSITGGVVADSCSGTPSGVTVRAECQSSITNLNINLTTSLLGNITLAQAASLNAYSKTTATGSLTPVVDTSATAFAGVCVTNGVLCTAVLVPGTVTQLAILGVFDLEVTLQDIVGAANGATVTMLHVRLSSATTGDIVNLQLVQASSSLNAIVDNTAPNTAITVPEPTPTQDTTPEWSFTGSDDVTPPGSLTFECQIDGGGFALCTSPFVSPVLGQGSHTFDVRAIDAAGNVDATPASATVFIDTVGPSTTILTGPTTPVTNSDSATFTFSGSDPLPSSGIAGFECQLDGGGFVGCSSGILYTGLSDGNHQFDVHAIDQAGNVGPDASYVWVVDTAGNNVFVINGPDFFTNDTSALFVFVYLGGDTHSFICDIDSLNNWQPCGNGGFIDSQGYPGPFTEGPHNFRVKAIDSANNPSPFAGIWFWNVDLTEPETQLTGTPPNPDNDTAPNDFTFIGTDDLSLDGFECNLDGSLLWVDCTSGVWPFGALADGSHTFMVRAIDDAGNVDSTPESYTWVVDATPPVVTITDNPPNPDNVGGGTFKFTATDTGGTGIATIECKIDAGAFAPCTSPFNYTGLGLGPHTFTVRATDNAGNVGTDVYAWVIIDNTPPDTFVDDGPATNNIGGLVTLHFEYHGVDDFTNPVTVFECNIDGGGWNPCNGGSLDVFLFLNTPGIHTFKVRAHDGSGNVDPTPAVYKWIVDFTPPVVTLKVIEHLPDSGCTGNACNTLYDGDWTKNQVTAIWTCADPKVGGVASGVAINRYQQFVNYEKDTNKPIEPVGLNNAVPTCVDAAGNVAGPPVTAPGSLGVGDQVRVDRHAPTCNATPILKQIAKNTVVTVNWNIDVQDGTFDGTAPPLPAANLKSVVKLQGSGSFSNASIGTPDTSIDFVGAKQTSWQVTWQVKDLAGNKSTCTAKVKTPSS